MTAATETEEKRPRTKIKPSRPTGLRTTRKKNKVRTRKVSQDKATKREEGKRSRKERESGEVLQPDAKCGSRRATPTDHPSPGVKVRQSGNSVAPNSSWARGNGQEHVPAAGPCSGGAGTTGPRWPLAVRAAASTGAGDRSPGHGIIKRPFFSGLTCPGVGGHFSRVSGKRRQVARGKAAGGRH